MEAMGALVVMVTDVVGLDGRMVTLYVVFFVSITWIGSALGAVPFFWIWRVCRYSLLLVFVWTFPTDTWSEVAYYYG